jgi:NSS family neurotransmitter:Na+ symporter
VLDALGLAFFSLSIGLGVHTTYGAYLPSSEGVLRSGVWVVPWRASSRCWRA